MVNIADASSGIEFFDYEEFERISLAKALFEF